MKIPSIARLGGVEGSYSQLVRQLANTPEVLYGSGAPAASSNEGTLYFDTSGAPYHGYVYHQGAWHQFS